MARATNDPAIMGYIGGVSINGTTFRATSCSLGVKQAINHPDVIDGAVDWTLYQLGGIEIDGDVAFPVIGGGFGADLIGFVARDSSGQLAVRNISVAVAYGKNAFSRTFTGCQVNTLEMRATAGERLDATVNLWGTDFENGGGAVSPPTAVQRVLSWADLKVNGLGPTCDVREFSFNVNNQLSRNYTFCPGKHGGYVPNNVSAGKRQVSGSIGYQGAAPDDDNSAEQNGTSLNPVGGTLTFDAKDFVVTFNNITYEYQSIEAQPGLITSTVNWYAHSIDGTAIE